VSIISDGDAALLPNFGSGAFGSLEIARTAELLNSWWSRSTQVVGKSSGKRRQLGTNQAPNELIWIVLERHARAEVRGDGIDQLSRASTIWVSATATSL
jgi:hypothetical protein